MDYQDTQAYWDKIFGQETPEPDVVEPLPFPEIERGLEWLCRDSGEVLDFGCGNGKVLFRCLALGVEKTLGIDISPEAITLAEKTARANGLADAAAFVVGGISSLKTVEDGAFDAVVLFNIIDNLIPDDARALLTEVTRITKPEAKVLMKLNDHQPDASLLADDETEVICPGFYREQSGIFLWNLSDKLVEELLAPSFKVEQAVRVEFKQFNAWNRMYFLQRKLGTNTPA